LGSKSELRSRLAAALGAFRHDQRGATAIEYALIATAVAAAIIAVVFTLGATLQSDYYQPAADKLSGG